MNKTKWVLRSITVCCVLVPLIFVGVIYRDNLLGLIVPPPVRNLMNNGNSDNNQANNNSINSTLAQFGINTNNLQTPQVESLSYDNQTGTADLTLNFTNPMKTQTLDVSSFSVDVADSNGTHLVTVQLDQGIDIGAGQTGNLSLMANALNDQGKALMESLISGNGGTIDTSDLQFTNLNANVGGIIIHVDNLNGFSQGINGNGS